jgi:hypothetical protein
MRREHRIGRRLLVQVLLGFNIVIWGSGVAWATAPLLSRPIPPNARAAAALSADPIHRPSGLKAAWTTISLCFRGSVFADRDESRN